MNARTDKVTPGSYRVLKPAGAVLGGGLVAAALWWRQHPSPCPHGQRFWVEAPQPVRGDARRLPYPDAAFDGAFLVAVLGEILDQEAVLKDLRRAIKPTGDLWSANCSVIHTRSANGRSVAPLLLPAWSSSDV